MRDTISVIVPVYNVAAYLPRCLDSILGQDHKNLEVILIDDGSKDASGMICDQYAAQDPRIRVIHQKNGGAAAAKNAGLRIASGEYLSFVDSDDYLEPNVYGYMLEVLRSEDADAAQFAFRDVYRQRSEDQVFQSGRSVAEGKAYLLRFPTDWTCALLWNKLYRRALFDGIFFEEGHKIDDEYFTYQGIMNARRVVCDDRIIYNYRRRASSVMLSPESQSRVVMDRIDAVAKRRQTVIRRFPELRRDFDVSFLDALVYMSEYPDNSTESLELLKSKLSGYFREKGNTLPPKCLWRGLVKLRFTKTEKLLAEYGQNREPPELQDYFK
ncbi:MAG: glycosyltransferase family 2 protein [Faecousia sp.]